MDAHSYLLLEIELSKPLVLKKPVSVIVDRFVRMVPWNDDYYTIKPDQAVNVTPAQSVSYGWAGVGEWVAGHMDSWLDRWMGGWTNGWVAGQMDLSLDG